MELFGVDLLIFEGELKTLKKEEFCNRPISDVTSRHVISRTGGQTNTDAALLSTISSQADFIAFQNNNLLLVMVNFCAVFNCSNRSDRESDRSYYRLPAIVKRNNKKKQELSRERRALWLSRIRREDLSSDPPEWVRVCSDHFISGV